MTRTRHILAILLSGLWFVPAASGQAKQVSLQFVSFPKAASPQPVELLVGDGKTIRVDLPSNSLSPEYHVAAMSNWILGKSGTDSEGKFRFETYGQGFALASDKQLILVTRKGADNSTGLELFSIDCGTGNFDGGKYLFVNATKTDIAGMIGDKKFVIQPRQHALVAPMPSKTESDRGYCYVEIFFRRDEKAEPFFTSTWRFSDKARSLVFFHHDPQNSRLRLHTIRDFPM